ncbi:pyrroline-5-carboxylate reductase [Desulfobotulus sp.]|jgi:pyrroline-5-carboxylate reductase|uniref:pyrroline-5-carboxylate reductase n=1 Tax=Desulfobotulus sp. TaxID=1940337 RepID=UPI002A36F791|nr:pyrroline-5-carboxylate reductase [Desulfobotulus sp.]MDY0162590.1 pyrroline-5-carboxylate reductase [Desulfobotulus sp.]
MPLSQKQIGFIGAGNMAEAMIQALRHGLDLPSHHILAADPDPLRRDLMTSRFGIQTTEDSMDVFMRADILVLAVKPQQMEALLASLTQDKRYSTLSRKKLILSIAAGISLHFLEKHLKASLSPSQKDLLVPIRVMPNTPCLVGCGMSGISRGAGVRDPDMEQAMALMSAMGKVCVIPESLMDALTALSGSGPAYLFLFAESMIRAGESLGLSSQDALTLTVQTLKGAVALLETGEADAATLRQRVTSPGGTTAAALAVLRDGGFEDLILRALVAARDRSRELSANLP